MLHDQTPWWARRFIAVALLPASLLGGTLCIGHLVAGESASFLPPYFTRKELREMAGEREAGNAAKTPRSAPPGDAAFAETIYFSIS